MISLLLDWIPFQMWLSVYMKVNRKPQKLSLSDAMAENLPSVSVPLNNVDYPNYEVD